MHAGGLVRPENMERIEYLAKIRNLASAPMQQVGFDVLQAFHPLMLAQAAGRSPACGLLGS